jgi:hypothetical protein
LITLVSFLKSTYVAHILGLLFSTVKVGNALILTKLWLEYIFGDVFYKLIWSPWPSTISFVLKFALKKQNVRDAGLPDFSWHNIPNYHNITQWQ